MKTLLICPAIRPAVAEIAEHCPLAIVPILGECLLAHWIEHLAHMGASYVRVIAADRAEHVRLAIGDGARWGVRIEVFAVGAEPTAIEAAVLHRWVSESQWLPAPYDVVVMDHLPGNPTMPLFESYSSWFSAIALWVPKALTPARIRVNEIRPGIWVSRRAHVSSNAELVAPCWIGDQVFVEPGAIVGPGAVIEDRSVIESEAHVTQSWVGPDTFVGPMTSVASSLAWGSTLTDWRSDSTLQVPDPFLLCSLATRATPHAGLFDKNYTVPAASDKSPLSWIPAWPRPISGNHDSNPPA